MPYLKACNKICENVKKKFIKQYAENKGFHLMCMKQKSFISINIIFFHFII
jgi:hypothetical protein